MKPACGNQCPAHRRWDEDVDPINLHCLDALLDDLLAETALPDVGYEGNGLAVGIDLAYGLENLFCCTMVLGIGDCYATATPTCETVCRLSTIDFYFSSQRSCDGCYRHDFDV